MDYLHFAERYAALTNRSLIDDSVNSPNSFDRELELVSQSSSTSYNLARLEHINRLLSTQTPFDLELLAQIIDTIDEFRLDQLLTRHSISWRQTTSNVELALSFNPRLSSTGGQLKELIRQRNFRLEVSSNLLRLGSTELSLCRGLNDLPIANLYDLVYSVVEHEICHLLMCMSHRLRSEAIHGEVFANLVRQIFDHQHLSHHFQVVDVNYIDLTRQRQAPPNPLNSLNQPVLFQRGTAIHQGVVVSVTNHRATVQCRDRSYVKAFADLYWPLEHLNS